MKTHRDVAEIIRETYISRQPRIDDIFDIGEIMGDNKAGGRPQDKDKKSYLLEKLKLYNVPTTKIQNGGASGAPGGPPPRPPPPGGAPGGPPPRPPPPGGVLVGAPGIEIVDVENWLSPDDGPYNLTYDQVKEDINIDSLNKDPGEVSSRDKQKYSSTNYNYSKEISDFMLENDYYSEFLKFTVYFGNFSIFAILLSILSYLSTYKGKVINNTNVTNYDKNIFKDQINKQKKYIYIFITIFSIITIFSLNPLKKYTLLIVKIIKSLFSGDVRTDLGASDGSDDLSGGGDGGINSGLAGDGDDGNIMEKIINFFGIIKQFILNHKISVIIIVLIICISILFAIPSFVTNRKKKEHDITKLFVKDLKRSQKLKEGDPEPKPLYEKKGNYICYNNLCTNNSSSINNKKAQVKKYNGTPGNIKKFKNLKECKSSGCETIGNSGIRAVKYSVTTI